VWLLIGLHVVMSVALACLFTPAFTTGLNPLPPHLYSHGSAVLTTLQQVAGAAGTAMLVAIYSGKTASLAASGTGMREAMAGGIQSAFAVATLFALVTIVLAAFMRRTGEGPAGHGGPVEPVRQDEPVRAD
jgi:DHA2 family lincomycin resistance protein-like MFS transporter